MALDVSLQFPVQLGRCGPAADNLGLRVVRLMLFVGAAVTYVFDAHILPLYVDAHTRASTEEDCAPAIECQHHIGGIQSVKTLIMEIYARM